MCILFFFHYIIFIVVFHSVQHKNAIILESSRVHIRDREKKKLCKMWLFQSHCLQAAFD